MVQERRPGRPLNDLDEHLPPEVKAFAERLRKFYRDMNVSMATLSKSLSCDASTLSRYLSGTTLPELGLLDRLYDAVEQSTNVAVHEDVRRTTRDLFYAACAVKDKPAYELYLLRDQREAADARAAYAEEAVDDLQAELKAAYEIKQLTGRKLQELQEQYSEYEASASRELQLAQDRYSDLRAEIKALREALRAAQLDLLTARAERERLAVLLGEAEAKLEQEIQRRWDSSAELQGQGEAGTSRLLGGRKRRKQIEQLLAEARKIADRLPEDVKAMGDPTYQEHEVGAVSVGPDELVGELAALFNSVYQQSIRLAAEQAMLRANVNSMFVNLSRRSQSLVQRQLRLIDELENAEQDQDQLVNLFKLDHLATRMRRNGENLLVLAGEEPGRKWSHPVRLLDVFRAGASEVEQYERVTLQGLPEVQVVGRVVNDLVHLVAELLENATSYSAPETRVTVTATNLGASGLMLQIEDSGIGMTADEIDAMNDRLANPPVIDVAISRRMGLYVVGRLAARHGIQVQLRPSASRGVTAVILVPAALLTDGPAAQ